MKKRKELRAAGKSEAKQEDPQGVSKQKQDEKGHVNVLEEEAEEPPSKKNWKEGDPESQNSTGLEQPLYVTSKSKRRFLHHFGRGMKQTFVDVRSRRALVCASTAMISQQLCGINTIGEPPRISEHSRGHVFATPYTKAISRFPRPCFLHTPHQS